MLWGPELLFRPRQTSRAQLSGESSTTLNEASQPLEQISTEEDLMASRSGSLHQTNNDNLAHTASGHVEHQRKGQFQLGAEDLARRVEGEDCRQPGCVLRLQVRAAGGDAEKDDRSRTDILAAREGTPGGPDKKHMKIWPSAEHEPSGLGKSSGACQICCKGLARQLCLGHPGIWQVQDADS